MQRKIISTAILLGLSAIVLGAFGAHGLKKFLTTEQLVSFETGVRYQMYHALFLLFLGLETLSSEKAKVVVYRFIVAGVLLFSGSIYLLTTKNLTQVDFSFLGPITPLGGMLLLIGWFMLFIAVLKKKS